MQNTDQNKMNQQGFDTVASGCDHSSLSFFSEMHDRHGRWKYWQCMEQLAVKHLVKHLQLKPTEHLLDDCTGTGIYCHRRKAVVPTFFTFHYSFFIVLSWWDVVWNAGWRALLNQMTEDEQIEFEKVHREEIADVLGNDGVWFNTEVLIAVREK